MDEQLLEKMIKEIVSNISNTSNSKNISNSSVEVSAKDYPLGYNRKDLIKTSTGKSLDDITLDAVMNDRVGPNDVRITAETLEYQAKIAESVGRKIFAMNLRRAAELTRISDDRILEIYNALRPFRSTKAELIAIADELENKYSATISASLVREAAEVYEKRDRLRRK
ncbi:diol dehydratase small subunit [Brachyspira hampsonii]|uniref:Propanediol dehydratase small subunit n=2 Tax=Brachyspira hampsonii TaxID=1287055 RepID=A0A2U4F1X2_9SPIR|nr:diol dehydratase small subunit [Brachyspira hampsonii]EKV56287.1 propanediol dehydratase small subunit [Brachyspira hampsonii 30446]MBW5389246.1 diol dehydratase small subunit [Brachyspira hampsonii]MBW5394879.1 diol dehydratase small subunit [Brachyspira hampsonii]OEJ13080.1 propanediol dehydratase [Brachyspira hampsonii]OEJ17121.1 propanediol dehydratase [Brachyspira hampsonii]